MAPHGMIEIPHSQTGTSENLYWPDNHDRSRVSMITVGKPCPIFVLDGRSVGILPRGLDALLGRSLAGRDLDVNPPALALILGIERIRIQPRRRPNKCTSCISPRAALHGSATRAVEPNGVERARFRQPELSAPASRKRPGPMSRPSVRQMFAGAYQTSGVNALL